MSSRKVSKAVQKLKEYEEQERKKYKKLTVRTTLSDSDSDKSESKPHNHSNEDACDMSCPNYMTDKHWGDRVRVKNDDLTIKLRLQSSGDPYEEYIYDKAHFERLGGYGILKTREQKELWEKICKNNEGLSGW
jgi:hypothetical protein